MAAKFVLRNVRAITMARRETFLDFFELIFLIMLSLINLTVMLLSRFIRSLPYVLYPYLHPVGLVTLVVTLFSQKFLQLTFLIWSYPRKFMLFRKLEQARTFEEWRDVAVALDDIFGLSAWRREPESTLYNYRNITERLDKLRRAKDIDDPRVVCNTIRTGLIRNMVNIAVPELYNKAFAGTKDLIESYAAQQVISLRYVMQLQTSPPHHTGFNTQAKLDFIRGARQGLGRSTLLFQGGSIFGACHIGVARALYREGLLPRVITGTATGAFVAALLCIRTDNELERFFEGEYLDIMAFEEPRAYHSLDWFRIFSHEDGYGGAPNLLNYITTPHVLIWSACLASNVSFAAEEEVTIWCKSETGKIVPWKPVDNLNLHSWHTFRCRSKESPLRRLPELLNVNHFIISQARPFIIPIFGEATHRPGAKVLARRWKIFHLLYTLSKVEIRCRLRQLDSFYCLPNLLRSILIEENIPGSCIVLLPQISVQDLTKVFNKPTRDTLKHWVLKGERGVWPSMTYCDGAEGLAGELFKGYGFIV
ncbi:lipase 5 [Coccidioides immitis H538.4]|uniref:Lipase 5 n=1 Tax=Coccidioides immitis H538.4 TaxID=396776 RepID=A0A0J8S2F2_COCIT|nr:lipase 5 [Coccidioides immitis H538.4]